MLTAQPSLDDGRIPHKKLRLAMAVGKQRHYAVDDILPRHFSQTAALLGVGDRAMRTILEDIAASAERQALTIVAALPDDFPEQLVTSTMAAIKYRSQLIADFMR